MPADVSAITYFAPIAVFLVVFLVGYAILAKTKILGESKFVQIFVSLAIAAIFISAVGAREFVQTIIPWFAVLLISLFLILLLLGLAGKDFDFAKKPIGIIVLIVFGLIFIISLFFVFSGTLVNYLPGPGYGAGGDESVLALTDWVYTPRVWGAIVLIVVAAIVSWVLVKMK